MPSRLRTESGAGVGRANWGAGRAIHAEENHEAKGRVEGGGSDEDREREEWPSLD